MSYFLRAFVIAVGANVRVLIAGKNEIMGGGCVFLIIGRNGEGAGAKEHGKKDGRKLHV